MSPIGLSITSILVLTSVALAEPKPPMQPPERPTTLVPGKIKTQPLNCVPTLADQVVRLDFANSSLADLAQEVGRHLCKNFILEPKLAQTPLYLISTENLRVAQLWQTFHAILAHNGLALVSYPNYDGIIRAVDATQAVVPLLGAKDPLPAENRMVSKVLKVKGDVHAINNYLNIFKSGQGQCHPFVSAGMILVTDYAPSVARLEWILAQLEEKKAGP